jgi:EmrB/QacA subfamily drug resistance transporter
VQEVDEIMDTQSHAADFSKISDQRSLLITFVLCGAAFMAMIDVFIVNVAFRKIGTEFPDASFAGLSWILNGYTIVYAALLIPFGALADKWGRKSAFLAGLTIFTLASVGCSISGSIWSLILFRGLPAAGAAMLTPSSLGLILTVLPAQKRPGAVKAWATTSAIAAAVGTALGGMLAEYSWRWIFIINLPVGVLAGVAAMSLIPRIQSAGASTRNLDFFGAMLAAIAVGSLSLAVVGHEQSTTSEILLCYAVAILTAAWLAWRILFHEAPIVDPGLFKVSTFTWANITIILFCTAFAALFLSISIWLQTVAGLSFIETGFAIVPGPVCVPIVASLTQKFASKASPRALVIVGNATFAIGALGLAFMASITPRYSTDIMPAWMLIGIGIGIAMPTMIGSASRDLPANMTATGSAVVNTSRQLGYVLGVALLVAVTGSLSLAPNQALPAFQTSWLLIALGAALSALTALGMRRTV